MKVNVFGLGRLGCPLATLLTAAGHEVVGIDRDPRVLELVGKGDSPVRESGLDELLSENRFIVTDRADSVAEADVSLIIVPTPSLPDDTFDNAFVLAAVKNIAEVLARNGGWHVVVVVSTVMPGSCDGVIRRRLEQISGRKVGDTVGLVYCVDELTEICTQRGWLQWNQVKVGDQTLGIDPATGESSWQPITKLFRERRQCEMILMDGHGHSSLTTPNHRWLVENQGRGYHFRTTETLRLMDGIPTAAPRADAPVMARYSDEFVELVAWFWTEGTKATDQMCTVTQSHVVNEPNVLRIRQCLEKLYGSPGPLQGHRNREPEPPWWREEKRGRNTVFFLSYVVRAQLQVVAPAKVPTCDFLLSLTASQLERFIAISIDGDGTRDHLGDLIVKTSLAQAGSGAHARVEAFAYACALAGRSVHVQEAANGSPNIVLANRSTTIPLLAAKATEKRRRLGVTPRARSGMTIERVPYDGVVWCPTVSFGNWLARRKGRMMFTGNSPEFVALGTVLHDMQFPDLVLIGQSDVRSGDLAEELQRSIVVNVPAMHRMSLINAEIAKLSLNCYVTMKISWANMLGELCEEIPGADARVVTDAIGSDSRIGKKYLRPATAFSGTCFPRDTRAFRALLSSCGSSGVPDYLVEATEKINDRQIARVLDMIGEGGPDSLGILGLAYKVGTPIADESTGTRLAEIAARSCQVHTFDPMVPCTATSAQECVAASDIVVIATPWPEFADCDYFGKYVIDCWGLVPTADVRIGVGP